MARDEPLEIRVVTGSDNGRQAVLAIVDFLYVLAKRSIETGEPMFPHLEKKEKGKRNDAENRNHSVPRSGADDDGGRGHGLRGHETRRGGLGASLEQAA